MAADGKFSRWRNIAIIVYLPCFMLQGAPIKNSPLEKMLYFSHGSMDLSQTFRPFMRVFTQHILRILLK